jgi:hypothetical protein
LLGLGVHLGGGLAFGLSAPQEDEERALDLNARGVQQFRAPTKDGHQFHLVARGEDAAADGLLVGVGRDGAKFA